MESESSPPAAQGGAFYSEPHVVQAPPFVFWPQCQQVLPLPEQVLIALDTGHRMGDRMGIAALDSGQEPKWLRK